MNRSGCTAHTTAAGVLAAAAASGLVLAGCGNGSGSPAASTSSHPAASASGSAPASSGSAGSSTVTAAGPAFFPLAVGDRWVYQEKLSYESGTVTNQVMSVTPAGDGNKVAMKIKDDLAGVHTATTSAFVIHPDGSISVPLTQLASTSVTVKSGSITWPSAAQLASGQPHHDTLVIAVKEGGHTLTVTAHVVVRGEGTQTVSVPAGTYQASLIDQTMTERVSGITVALDIRTWVANGVGPVKSELRTDADGRDTLTNVQDLKSFTKG